MEGFGAFGKMPALGDFFRIALPPGFEAPWDEWVQEGLLAARAALADRWQDCFFSAPIWRFTLAPTLAGRAAVQGVLMASVDRVGRQFPLTLVAALRGAGPPDVVTAHLTADACFAELEDVALDALDDRMTIRALAQRLQSISPPIAPNFAASASRTGGGRIAMRCVGDLRAAIGAELGAVGYARPSIWTASLPGETLVYLQDGLPAPARMADFYDIRAAVWQTTRTGVPTP